MIRTRSRYGLMATVLAFCALLAINALAGWHAADAHVDRPAIELAGDSAAGHAHDAEDEDGDLDHAIHGAAHTASQPVDLALNAAELGAFALALHSWVASDAVFRTGLAPTALIRPPRA